MPTRNATEWLHTYDEQGAYWEYDPNVLKLSEDDLHAELASGLHSDRFFNTQFLIQNEDLLGDAAHDIVERFIWWLGVGEDGLGRVSGAVGPARGATKLAELVAREIGQLRGSECPWGSPEKVGDGSRLEFPAGKWKSSPSGNLVIIVEDVITTAGTTGRAEEAVLREGAKTFTAVGCIINRSGAEKVEINGGIYKHVLANVHLTAPAWEPKVCPLCAKGSTAIKPKPKDDPEGRNWKRLKGQVA